MKQPTDTETGRVLTITLFVPGQLSNPLNGSRLHWTAWYARANGDKARTLVAWLAAGRPVCAWEGPSHFQFTVSTAQLWDEEEGIMAACKNIRDQATRSIAGTDDSRRAGHRYSYANDVRPARERGVLITVEPR